ncbi:MAG: translocation/assembly module TamB domain-containing protein [Thermoanaerobaculia bacterium]|nr:translocation/assembly module TamB domain-containing protein [Thermoanaerobaculia bacterium]
MARWGCAGLLLVSVLLGGLAWFTLATEPGTRWLFTRLGAIMPGELKVAELEGPIRGPLTVRGLRYANDSMEVTVERLFLDWRLRELLSKRLDIHLLEADGIDILTLPGPEDAARSPLPDVDLRFNVIVRDAKVRGLTIRSADKSWNREVDATRVDSTVDRATDDGATDDGATEPLIIDSIDLATTARGGQVVVDRLVVRAPDFDLDATGTLRPQGAYDVDLETHWVYRGAEESGQPTFSGGGTLSGTLEELRVRQTLAEPFALNIDALLRDPLYDLAFQADLVVDGISARTFSADAPEMLADARLFTEGTLERLDVRGTVNADTADYGPLAVSLDLELDLSKREERRIILREFVTTRPQSSTQVTARGELILPAEGEPRFDLAASWRDVSWPLEGEPTASSSRGEATVVGSAEDYRLDAELAVAAAALETLGPIGVWSFEGRGNTRSFDLTSLSGQLLRGSLAGSGRVVWDPRVEWNLDLVGRGIDPSVLAAEYPGSLDFSASTSGYVPDAEGAGPTGRVELTRLEGILREQPISARGRVELADDSYHLDPLEVTWAADSLTVSGTLGSTYDLTLRLDAPNLAVALDGISGTLRVDATVVGPADALKVALSAQGESLSYQDHLSDQDYRVGRLDLESKVDLSDDGPIDLDLTATRVDLGTVQADRVVLTGAGTQGMHTATLDLFPEEDGNDGAVVRLALSGGLDATVEESESNAPAPRIWRGRMTRLDVDVDRLDRLGISTGTDSRLGTWNLAGPAGLIASSEEINLSDFCWAGQGRVCAEGEWTAATGWRADARLTDVPLSLLSGFLPPDVEVSGNLNGTVAARANADGQIEGSARLIPGPGEVVYPVASEREQRLHYQEASITAIAGTAGVTADLALVLVDVGRVDGHLELPGFAVSAESAESQEIRGRLTVDLADLSIVQALVDGVRNVGGQLDADLTVAGTTASPEIRGGARLKEATLDYPEYGLELRDLSFTALGVGREPIALSGSVRSGDGTIELVGTVPISPSTESPARLAVNGQRFELIDTEEIRVLASPDLTLTYDGAVARLAGEVLIPEANLEVEKRVEGGAVASSRDVVFVGPDAVTTTSERATAFEARVRVALGADVKVDVLGLAAEPTGSLLLVEEPGRPTSATGQLELNKGTFQAYGQDLTLERGRLVFAGPVTDPGIDLRASRRADDGVVAGLDATGTLSRPVVTLWSEPSMSQSDQLSYVLLGKPIAQVGQGDSDGSLLANAATALGIKGGNLLGERISARYGLEEARIEAEDGLESASLVLGKYLSPRLFVGYGIGLFDAVNTFRIRYLLNDKLTLEGETGNGTSADILYTLERGEGAKRRLPAASMEEVLDDQPKAPSEDQE